METVKRVVPQLLHKTHTAPDARIRRAHRRNDDDRVRTDPRLDATEILEAGAAVAIVAVERRRAVAVSGCLERLKLRSQSL